MNTEVQKIDDAVKADLKASMAKLVAFKVSIKTADIHDFLSKATNEAETLGKKVYDEIHHIAIAIDDEVKHFSIDELKNLLGFGVPKKDTVMHLAPTPSTDPTLVPVPDQTTENQV